MNMWNNEILSYIFLFSIFINQILCKLTNQKDGISKSDLYQKKNIDRAIIVRPIPPPLNIPPFFKPQPPIILTIGVPNGLPNLGFNPYNMVGPGLGPGLGPRFISGFGGRFNPGFGAGYNPVQNPNFEFGNGENDHFINLADFMKQANVNVGPSAPSVQYFRPQVDQAESSDEVTNQHPKNLEPQSAAPHVEILKSLGYTLPSEFIFNHPVTYAKEYLLDSATSNSVKNIKQKPPSLTNPDLLTGEEETTSKYENDEILTEVESKSDETTNKMETITMNFPNQYHYSNRNPITFDNANKKPKNIYEIISAERIVPKEVEMTQEGLNIKMRNDKENEKVEELHKDDDSDSEESLETEENEESYTDENLIESEKRNLTTMGEDSDLRVLELEKRDDQLLLLLPQENVATLKKPPKKRSTNDSFNVNIGAGYGVGIDQNTPILPESTTQINSTNPLTTILRDEHVIIGKFPGGVPKFDSDMVESKSLIQTEPKKVEVPKSVMGMKEIQQILHNVDDNSEYSKIVQVVKVPAVYEIHLEKLEKNHQHAPKQYIQQINNLANKPKKKPPIKVKNKESVYSTKDYIKLDHWQQVNQNKNLIRIKKPNRSTNNYKYLRNSPYINKQNPVHELSTKQNFREKKNTDLVQNYYPQNHQSQYKPEYVPYYPPVQKHSVYTTLTRHVPFAAKRKFNHRSEILDDNLIYGTTKEKVLLPDEINITIQPGTTMVTLPKLDESKDRNFVEDREGKGCKKEYSQPEVIQPPELKAESRNIDNIYFTTLKPIEKEDGSNDRSRFGYFKPAERRSGLRPVKYMLYINKIVTDGW